MAGRCRRAWGDARFQELLAVAVAATAATPDRGDGWQERLHRAYYGVTSLAGTAIRDGRYQLDDARRLVDEVDPSLESYFGRRGAEVLIANSPDPADSRPRFRLRAARRRLDKEASTSAVQSERQPRPTMHTVADPGPTQGVPRAPPSL